MRSVWPKLSLLIAIVVVYVLIAFALIAAVSAGVLHRSAATLPGQQGTDTIAEPGPSAILTNLQAAEKYVETKLMQDNGHIRLYVSGNVNLTDNGTNSEAASYFLLSSAQNGDKAGFDKELDFVQAHMLEPDAGYMMWKLTDNDSVVKDGANIASDADLRAIKALFIAQAKWPSANYAAIIDKLAGGIEKVAVTTDGYLAPYGGMSGTSPWTAREVWLSYTDFTVLRELAQTRGAPWTLLYTNMKNATLGAQLQNGLYNTVLTEQRQYGNSIDAGGYSINSMWMMVRNAESGDADLVRSANKSLQFYKQSFQINAELYANYNSNGDALNPSDTPWVYALVGRAAISLGDKDFAKLMLQKLLEDQVMDQNSTLYGAFPEYYGNYTRVGQFTMQESILTMQAMYAGLPVS